MKNNNVDDSLKKLFEESGFDFYLNRLEGNKAVWSRAKKYSECTEQERQDANIRQILPMEILLDCDHGEEQAQNVIHQLKRENATFCAYLTHSRGMHIYLYCKDIQKKLSKKWIPKFRKYVIKRYGCDMSCAGNYRMISIHNRRHFKSGENVNLKEKHISQNDFCFICKLLEEFKLCNELWHLEEEETRRVDYVAATTRENNTPSPIPDGFIDKILLSNPPIRKLVNSNDVANRSGADYAVTKCLAENKIASEAIYAFLKTVPWSNVTRRGRSYFDFTYRNVLRDIQKGLHLRPASHTKECGGGGV